MTGSRDECAILSSDGRPASDERVTVASKTQIEIGELLDASSSVPAELPAGIVHLWFRSLDSSQAEVDACYELLSAEERDRAERFKIERPRTAFVLTRGTLRSLLGRYLRIDAKALRFLYESMGKPFLEKNAGIGFNVSHTDGLALLGFVRSRSIGVDVEKVKAETEVGKLAERFFSERERGDLRLLRGDELRTAFFRVWTRKEAYIKARGEGLSLPLHQFDVAVGQGECNALLGTRPDPSEAGRWTVRDLWVGHGYAAALAVAEASEV